MSRRQVALFAPVAVGASGWLWAPQHPARSEVRLQDELPPLPKPYHDAVLELATAIRKALQLSVGRIRGPPPTAQDRAELQKEEAKVATLLERYSENYLSVASRSKLEAVVLEHPVFFAMRQAVERLQSGGQGEEDLTGFRFELIRAMNTVIKLTEKAGIAS